MVVALAHPPPKLVSLVGSDFWARGALWFTVSVALFFLLVVLGVAGGKVGMPFGFSIERSKEDDVVALVSSELAELRAADKQIAERSVRSLALLEQALERIADLEAEKPRGGRND